MAEVEVYLTVVDGAPQITGEIGVHLQRPAAIAREQADRRRDRRAAGLLRRLDGGYSKSSMTICSPRARANGKQR